ncbi:MAG: prepilin-type N-terminal cleavage/methylation domain-containing protein [Planctomycetota bacterium]
MTSATGTADRRVALRSGFTLIEVMLVLALLVVISALAAPSLIGSLQRSRLDAAASELRTAWAQARLDAASSGETLRFQCRLQTGWGCVANASASLEEVDAALAAEQAEGGSPMEWTDVVFTQLLVANTPGEPPLGESVADGELSAAVLFRPDGTTSDAEAVLEDATGAQLKVTLRGLTGSARIEDVAPTNE